MYNNYQEQNIKMQKELYEIQKTMIIESFKMFAIKAFILGFVVGILKGICEIVSE